MIRSAVKLIIETDKITGVESRYYTVKTNRYISKDRMMFDCLNCENQCIDETERCWKYDHPEYNYGICFNFLPEGYDESIIKNKGGK